MPTRSLSSGCPRTQDAGQRRGPAGRPLLVPDQRVRRAGVRRTPVPADLGRAGQRTCAGAGSTRLLVDGRVHERGAVGVLLGADVRARALVSQGCRAVGPAMTVTAAEGNVLLGLAGCPALDKLEEIVGWLPPADQALVTTGLHVGIAMDEYADDHDSGSFLVRGVVGADRRPSRTGRRGGGRGRSDRAFPGARRRGGRCRPRGHPGAVPRRGAAAGRVGRRRAAVLLLRAAARTCSPAPTTTCSPCATGWRPRVSPGSSPRERSVPVVGRTRLHGSTASVLAFS